MAILIKFLLTTVAICLANTATAAPVLDTVLVLIDEKTEQRIGEFPYERDVLANGIEQLHKLGAKEVLLKLFLDTHKNRYKDKRLANVLKKIPVTLQARLDDAETNPNPLLPKHKLADKFKTVRSNIRAESGWLPVIEFSQNAKAIGFIDSIYPVTFIETYKGDAVGSLYFHALESIYKTKIDTRGNVLYLGEKIIRVNSKGDYRYDWKPEKQTKYISFIDLIEDKVDANLIAGKYVVLGYDGKRIHQLQTPNGLINAHVAFYQSLLSVISSIK